jgi:heptosyltransferase III
VQWEFLKDCNLKTAKGARNAITFGQDVRRMLWHGKLGIEVSENRSFCRPNNTRKLLRLLHRCISGLPRQIWHFMLLILYAFAHFMLLTRLVRKMKHQDSKRHMIAIVLLEHFGDIVACEPTTRYLRLKYPDAYIIWFTSDKYNELLQNNPHVDKVVLLYCLTEWMLLSRLRLFHAAYNLHANERCCSVCGIALHKQTGETAITIGNYFNYGSLLGSFARSAGLPSLNDGPKVYLSDSVVHSVDSLRLPRELLVVHCVSNEISKDWLSNHWDELINRLLNSFNIHIAEVGLTPAVSIKSSRYFNFCNRLSLLETAEVIRRARLFIGVDSGPAHLANAVRTRGVILLGHYRLFCKYNPFSGGYSDGSNAELLYVDGPVAGIPVERVFQAVAAGLKGYAK